MAFAATPVVADLKSMWEAPLVLGFALICCDPGVESELLMLRVGVVCVYSC